MTPDSAAALGARRAGHRRSGRGRPLEVRLSGAAGFAALAGLAACGGDRATGSGGAGGTPVSLAVGQSVLYADAVAPRLALSVTAGAQYVIAVANTSTDASAGQAFDLRGAGGPTANAAVEVPRPAIPRDQSWAGTRGGGGPRTVGPEGAAAHLALLDAGRQIFRRIVLNGGLAAIRRRGALHGRAAAAPVPGVIDPTPGAVNRVFVRNNLSGSCGRADTITARTVFASSKLIVLEDDQSATAGHLDAFLSDTVAAEFDADTYPEVTTNFGDPLLVDSVGRDSLHRLGRVTALISPVLNTTLRGVAGFVNPCDFLPNGFVLGRGGPAPDTVRSNETEIAYLFAPDNSGARGAFSTAEWKPFVRSVLAHESKHIASFAAHLSDGASSFETSWLEEATAQMSAEIWARDFLPTAWKGNDGYQQTVACELGLNAACAPGRPITYSDSHFPFLYAFMSALETESVLGPATEAKYGGSWMFVRWTTDQFAAAEATYLRSIIDDPVDTGLTNLSVHAGASPGALILEYYVALAAAHAASGFTPTDARLGTPSYDLRDAFRGITQLDHADFPLAYPLVPREVRTGSFDIAVTGIRGGGASVFLLTAEAPGTQSIEIEQSGAALPSSSPLRLGVIRVH